VIDGKGMSGEGKLIVVNEKECIVLAAETFAETPKKYLLHIAIAPTKNMDRVEWFAEKATELGIDRISFVLCKNSERKVIKVERIRKIVEGAVKQSMQAFIPMVDEAIDFKKFIEENKTTSASKFIAHCEKTEKRSAEELVSGIKEFLFLIGPEGDFTREEIETALSAGFSPVALGESRLRTETAGIYVAAMLRSLIK
jgi:16S rRNA (uracil1498-N3)-methyltransferase